MSYDLILERKINDEGNKLIGQSIYLADLPRDPEIFVFYYPSESYDSNELDLLLNNFGRNSGSQIFVNCGEIGDANYKRVLKDFDVTYLPVAIITGKDSIACLKNDYEEKTVYVKFEGNALISDPRRTMERIQNTINFFISGNIKMAQKQTKLMNLYKRFDQLKLSLKQIVGNIEEISFGLIDGTFKVKLREVL